MIRNLIRAMTASLAAWAALGATAQSAPAQTGACCFACLSCYDDVTAADCALWGGTYKGNGTVCASVVCDTTVGACCITGAGYCYDCQSPANCTSLGGQYQGGGSTCANVTCDYDYGACCTVSGSCYETYRDSCLSDIDNQYRGDNTTCAAANCTNRTGACCYTGGCHDTGGINSCQTYYNGTFTLGATCVSSGCYGACCSYTGSCYETTEANCLSQLDYTFHGGGTSCASTTCPVLTGACCLSPYCYDFYGEQTCLSQGGTFFLGQDCTQANCPGACCLPDQTCQQQVSDEVCAALGGHFGGSLSQCADLICTTACTNTATLVSSNYRIFPSSILIDDINKDGWWEVIFVAEDTGFTALSAPNYPTCQSPSNELGVIGGGGPDSCGGGNGQLRVHVLNGATNYASELSGWPIAINGSPYTVTVATGDINFDGYPDVMVGSGAQCMSFRFNGAPTPGWESVPSPFTFQNAFTITDSNADGAPDMICVDESTFYQRFQALGRKWQCQYVSDPVYSTAAVGDVGRKHATLPRVADGIPDAVTCGEISLSTYNPIRVYGTFGVTIDCVLSPPGGFQDQLFQIDPPDWWFSSPALARLDRVNPASTPLDAAQEIVLVNAEGWLRVYNSRSPTTPSEVQLGSGFSPRACKPHYSSPAIVDLNSDSLRQEILVGSDDGRIYAFRYDASIVDPTQRLVPMAGWVGGKLLDDGAAVSASPIVADVVGDTRPEVIIANDAGKVYIIDWQGNTLSSWCCRPTGVATAASAIYSTPAVWVRRPSSTAGSATRKPMIFAGNRHGLWRIDLSASPDFVTTRAQWPTFHKDNGRTGAWPDYAINPGAGSIGGIVCTESAGTFCELFYDDTLLQPVKDPQNSPAPYTFTSVSDGRFVFDMLKPTTYFVRFTDANGVYVKKVPVSAGKMTFLKGCCERGRPDGTPRPTGVLERLQQALIEIELQAASGEPDPSRTPAQIIYDAIEAEVYATDPYCVNY